MSICALFFSRSLVFALNVDCCGRWEKYCKGEIWKVNWYAPIGAYFTFFYFTEWNQSKHVARIFFPIWFFCLLFSDEFRINCQRNGNFAPMKRLLLNYHNEMNESRSASCYVAKKGSYLHVWLAHNFQFNGISIPRLEHSPFHRNNISFK